MSTYFLYIYIGMINFVPVNISICRYVKSGSKQFTQSIKNLSGGTFSNTKMRSDIINNIKIQTFF